MDVNKIVASKKFPFGKQDPKYFIGYKHDKKLNLPLFSFFPEMNPCRIDLDETERRSFLMKDKQFLEKYNETLGKVSDTVNKI